MGIAGFVQNLIFFALLAYAVWLGITKGNWVPLAILVGFWLVIMLFMVVAVFGLAVAMGGSTGVRISRK